MTVRNRASSPHFTVRQTHSYCFRMVVPPRYRHLLGRVELRYTLHTGSLSQAKARARTIAAYVLDLFGQLSSSDSSPTQHQHSIRDFVADQLVAWTDHSSYVSEPEGTVLPSSSSQQVPQQTPNSSLVKTLLTQVISEYAAEKKNAGKWTLKTEQENQACYRLFLSWAGERVMVEDITAKMMREYKAALQRLPANMEKSPQYRGKTIKELLHLADQGQIPTVMGIATINKNLNRMSTVLAYAVKNGYIPFNPAADMQVEQPKRDEELRDTFSHDDLHALFHSPQYTQDTFKHPYQFWTPLLALFTAARQNELAQLYLDDLRQEDGVWVFDITGKRPDQRLKNKNSARLIPIHPFLLELGLVRYAQELQAKGESRLFPELTHRRDGYGQDVSRWFNGNGISQGYRQRCGVVASPGQGRKDFHSFRHTTITFLVGKRVDMNLLHKLDGHKLDSMTLDRYGKGWSLVHAMKAEVIDLLDFHKTIPLEHLNQSKYTRPYNT